MTRKEQIKEVAKKEMSKYPNFCITAPAFRMGAEWADAHPDIDVRTMAAWQSGYKEAIEKACEWLSVELDKEEELHYIHLHGFDKERREIFIEELKKAMKGGNQ